MDSRQSATRRTVFANQANPARAPAALRLRRSLLPQHWRMLRQGHRDLHDSRRPVHPSLSVLRCRTRPPRTARRTGTRQLGEGHRRTAPIVCRHHQRRPGRPTGRRRRTFCRLHSRNPRPQPVHPHRDTDPRLSRPDRKSPGRPCRPPAQCLQSQLGNGSPPVPRSATGRRLRKLPTPSRKNSKNGTRRCRQNPG